MSSEVICDTCGQTGMFVPSGTPCLRKYADGSKICQGTMVEITSMPTRSVAAERQAHNRKQRRVKGICRQCSNKLAPNSIAFCETHLKQHREKAKQKYVSKN